MRVPRQTPYPQTQLLRAQLSHVEAPAVHPAVRGLSLVFRILLWGGRGAHQNQAGVWWAVTTRGGLGGGRPPRQGEASGGRQPPKLSHCFEHRTSNPYQTHRDYVNVFGLVAAKAPNPIDL